MKYDIFISYASEESSFATQLLERLKRHCLRIWFDKREVTIGDTLLHKIDQGLSQSRYAIVILSDHYFKKPWTKYELSVLVKMEHDRGKIILPVWHGISRETIAKCSPTLAGKFAVTDNEGMDAVVAQILRAIEPDVVRSDELSASLKDLNDSKRIKHLINTLKRHTNPDSYKIYITESNEAARHLIGGFPKVFTPDDCYRAYAKRLGFPEEYGPQLFDGWLTELQEDPWWHESMMSRRSYQDPPTVPPNPGHIVACACRLGDILTVLCVCQHANRAGLVARNREYFISVLKTQTEQLRIKVYKEWVDLLVSDGKGDLYRVAEDPVKAFKVLQRFVHISMQWKK